MFFSIVMSEKINCSDTTCNEACFGKMKEKYYVAQCLALKTTEILFREFGYAYFI